MITSRASSPTSSVANTSSASISASAATAPRSPSSNAPRSPRTTQRRNLRPGRRTRRAVRHLERLPLDTPYTVIAERIARLANQLAASNPLQRDRRCHGRRPACRRCPAHPRGPLESVPVTIGHADRETYVDGFWRVGKRDLIARLQVAFDFDELTIARDLPEAETLIEELTAMRATIRSTGRTRYESPGEAHDDLAIALALAWWGADTRRPGDQETKESIGVPAINQRTRLPTAKKRKK